MAKQLELNDSFTITEEANQHRGKRARKMPGPLPGTQLGGYTATDNLRGTQVTPQVDPRTTQAISGATQAAGQVSLPGGYQPVGRSNTAQAMDAYGRARSNIQATNPNSMAAGRARTMALSDLANLSGPNRGQIAQDVFGQIRESTEPQFQKDLQNVGRRAAALGRLGAGMTTSELGDVVSNRERDLSLAQRGLASEAASRSLDDRLGVFNARLGASGQFTNEDLARAGFGLSRAGAEQSLGQTLERSARADRAEDVQERDFRFNEDLTRAGLASDRGRLYQDLADQVYGQNRGYRDELRGERGFQNDMSQQAFDNYVRQRQLEEMLLQGEFGRDLDYTNTLLGYGYGG